MACFTERSCVQQERTVAAAIRVMGLSQDKHFINYHWVLSRAVWSSRKASQILLLQLIAVFAAKGVIVLGLDDTIERRRGKQIAEDGHLSEYAPVMGTLSKRVDCVG